MTKRPLAALAFVCLTLAACDLPRGEQVQEEQGVSDEPAPRASTPAPPAAAPVARPEEAAVGERVISLTDDWFQGRASVGGTQLVVFFEMWCPQCRNEVPRLQALHDSLGDDGLQIVGLTRLTRNGTEEQLATFIDEHGLTYPVGRTPPELARQLRVRGIPAAALLKDGEVVWRGHPARMDAASLRAHL